MAHSIELWDKAREYFEAGLPLSDITKRTGITKSQISKRSNKYEWEKETEKKRLITQAVAVAVGKETLNETELEVHNEIVNEQTRRLNLVYGATEKILKLSGKMAEKNSKQVVMKVKEYSKENGSSESLDKIDVELDASDLKNLAETVDKASITLGINQRHANSQVTVNTQNNLQQNTNIEIEWD